MWRLQRRGHHQEQAAFGMALIGILIFARRNFTVRSQVPGLTSLKTALIRMSVVAAVAFGYGVTGFWLLDQREFGIDFNWLDSIYRTLRFLTLAGDSSLVPRTHHAQWFLDSLTMMTVTVSVYAAWSLFRPIVYRFATLPAERELARQISCQSGRSSLDYFKLWPDKSFFFESSLQGFVAYRVNRDFAVALGDPLGTGEQLEQTVRQFKQFCENQGWGLAFHQTHPDLLPLYQRLGFKKLKIGEDAIVDLTQFSLENSSLKRFRQRANQLEKHGVRMRYHAAPVDDTTLRQLREVSDQWLRIPGRRERTFTVGQFDEAYLRRTPVITAENAEGTVLAFINVIPSGHPGETTIDLMRHRPDAPNGIMDYLFVKLFALSKEQGFTRFNLGMAPMCGFQQNEEPSLTERAVHTFFRRLNSAFSFQGLKQYKSKFADFWEPRYLIYRHALDLPKAGIALTRITERKTEPGFAPGKIGLAALALIIAALVSTNAAAQTSGKNLVNIRGQQQEVYYYPATGQRLNRKVLFAPGDGGWRGWAITVAQQMASWGYDVYGLDTKTYLTGFTGKTTLTEPDVMGDFRSVAQWMTGNSGEKVTLVGWSEGAGLAVLAAAAPENKRIFSGLILFGLGDENVLGWTWKDNLTYVTKSKPSEPKFRASSYVGRITPLPVLMIYSSNDEYVPFDEAKTLATLTKEPKRVTVIPAANHRFDGNLSEFYRTLREGLQWIK